MTRTGIRLRASSLSVVVATLMLSYAFLYGNATSLPLAAGYSWTRLIALPRQIRFVEFAGVGTLVCLLFLARRISTEAVTLAVGCLVFSSFAAMSYLHHPLVGLIDFVRLVYMYILPILVFVIARELPWRPSGLSRLVAFILLWVLVSAAVSWVQYLYLGYQPGDDITGLNQDAHVNVGLLIVATLLLLAQGLFFGRRRRVLLAVVLGATAALPSALKMLAMMPFLVGMLLRYYSRHRRRTRVLAISKRAVIATAMVVTVVAVTFVSFSRIDLLSSARLPDLAARVASDPLSFGPFVAHGRAARVLLQGPSSFLLGLGPFSYSNPISMGQSTVGGDLGRFTAPDLASDVTESGEDARVSLTTSLAVELGVPAFLLLVCLYGVVIWRVHRCTRSTHRLIRAYGAAVTPGLLLLLGVGVVTEFSSITSLALSWPLMILAGAVVRLHARGGVSMARLVSPQSTGFVRRAPGVS